MSSYDKNGNMLTKTGKGENWQLQYNALNQVTRASISGPQGSSAIDYSYDHDGIRIGKTINGTEITNYVVDKNRPYAQVLEEAHLSGGLSAVTSYIYGDGLISGTIDGFNRDVTRFYHMDGMGSVRGLSDSSGLMTDQYSYDAYGMLLDSSGTNANPYRYRGEQYDSNLDSYYLRARYYQPGIGRFLTTDPVEGFPNAPTSLHRYLYGNDAPANFLDPSGEMSLPEMLVTAGIVGTLTNLSTFAVGQTGWGKDVMYPSLAEYVYPEGYVVGFNITGKFPLSILYEYLEYINMIFDQSPVPGALSFIKNISLGNAVTGFGAELLLSVGSSEVGLFTTRTSGAIFELPNVSAGFELYDGFVYNLWNAKDYHGPFESLALNSMGSGGSLFWDANRGFAGPWGGASTFFSKSADLIKSDLTGFGFGKSNIYYDMVGEKPWIFERPAIVAAILVENGVKSMLASRKSGGIAISNFLFNESLWGNIALAHLWWNYKEPQYSIDNRRLLPRERIEPPYRSGPSYWLLPI